MLKREENVKRVYYFINGYKVDFVLESLSLFYANGKMKKKIIGTKFKFYQF